MLCKPNQLSFRERILQLLGLQPPPVYYIGGSDILPPPLSREAEQDAILALERGEAAARSLLIEHNLRLVVFIAKRFENTGVNLEDLISIGTIGLIKAINTFQSGKNIKLATYASRCIENEILMYLRSNRKHRGTLLLGDSLGSDPEGGEMQLSDLLGTDENLVPDEAEMAIEARRALRLMNRVLDERERRVVWMRCGLDDGEPKPQHEIARRLGISRSYVSRIEKKALNQLRAALEGGQ